MDKIEEIADSIDFVCDAAEKDSDEINSEISTSGTVGILLQVCYSYLRLFIICSLYKYIYLSYLQLCILFNILYSFYHISFLLFLYVLIVLLLISCLYQDVCLSVSRSDEVSTLGIREAAYL